MQNSRTFMLTLIELHVKDIGAVVERRTLVPTGPSPNHVMCGFCYWYFFTHTVHKLINSPQSRHGP